MNITTHTYNDIFAILVKLLLCGSYKKIYSRSRFLVRSYLKTVIGSS